MRIFVILFTLIPLTFMGVGTYLAWSQHHKVTTFEPVSALVLDKRVERHTSTSSKGGSSTTYTPVVEYEYVVEANTYRNNDVFPLSSSAGHDWAHATVRRFNKGQTYPAYVNPDDPTEAFLLPEHSFLPYIFILFPVLFLVIGLGVWLGGGASAKKPPDPIPSGEGWFEIQPTSRIADRSKAAILCSALWYGIGMLACGHYFMATDAASTGATIGSLVYLGFGLIPAGLVVYYRMLGKQLGDARVWVNAASFNLGDQLAISAQQPIYTNMMIESLKLLVQCEEKDKQRRGSKTTYTTNTVCERDAEPVQNQAVQAGDTLRGEATIQIPPEGVASTPHGKSGYPRYRWQIAMKVQIPGKPDYRAEFPITVAGPPQSLADVWDPS